VEELYDEEPLGEEPLGEEPLDEEPLDEESLGEESLGEESLGEESLGEHLRADETREGLEVQALDPLLVPTGARRVMSAPARDPLEQHISDLAAALRGTLHRSREVETSSGLTEELSAHAARLSELARGLSLEHDTLLVAEDCPVSDLTSLVEAELRELAEKLDDMPRLLFRSGGHLPVRVPVEELQAGLLALLHLATACTGPDEELRISTSGGPMIELELTFPAGPLGEHDVARLFLPYAMEELIPQLDPRALANASGAARGAGGSLRARWIERRLLTLSWCFAR